MSAPTKRLTAIALVAAVALVYALPIPAQDTVRPPAAASTIQTHLLQGEGGNGVLVVVDAGRPALATYEINAKTGHLTLKSVRQIGPDLNIDNFNSGGPTPQEIRTGFGT